MTSKRSLGPILAMAGAAIVGAAVVAGFIAIGGPGDARDRRLDEMMIGKMTDVANIAQCAFNATGVVSASIEDAAKTRGWLDPDVAPELCSFGTTTEHRTVSSGAEPGAAGDVSYAALPPNRIKVCGNFRRPSTATDTECRGICYGRRSYPELLEPRLTAGQHCYEIQLAAATKTSALLWDEPIDFEAMSPDIAADAVADKRTIDDVVNVLRMAQCAQQINGEAPQTFIAGLASIERDPRAAQAYDCDWAPSYFSVPDNLPVVRYDRVTADLVRVCGKYARAWPMPLRLNYYGAAAFEWPTSLPALQKAVEAGQHCYEVELPLKFKTRQQPLEEGPVSH